MTYPHKMMLTHEDELLRKWNRLVALAKTGSSSKKEVSMSKWKLDDIVLMIEDKPRTRSARRADEFYRQRSVDADRRETVALVRRWNADAPPFANYTYPDRYDPALPFHAQRLAVRR